MAETLYLPKSDITKILAKSAKEKEKERDKKMEATIYQKISPSNTLLDQEGWKVSPLKGMYATKLLALTHVILLKGNKLTYVAKKLLTLVVLAK
jgi:hypothetical protein